jgi:tetratricopeptide (TPR) repeat protein
VRRARPSRRRRSRGARPGPAGALAAFLLAALGPVVWGAQAPQAEGAPKTTAPKAAPPPAGKPASPSFDDVVKKASEAKDAGRYDDAIGLYRQALRMKPTWLEGRFILGTMLYDNDRFEEAREEFRRLVQAEPKNGLVLALKGLSEFQLKNYERALKELQAGRELGIASPEVLSVASYHAAILLNRIEQYESAFEILRTYAQKDQDTQGVIEAFGLSVLRMPFLPSEAPPDRREMILMAGRAGYHQAKGRSTAHGRQAFEELVSRFPTAPNVHYAFGVYLLSEQPEMALEKLRRELRSSPNHYHAMLQIAYELIKQGKYEEAMPMAEKATELAPNLFAARNALGRILLETGDVERAIQELEAGVKLAPDSPEMRFSLARAYGKAGRTEDAARERAAFVKMERARRTARSGPQSVGGKDDPPVEPPPPKD